MPGPDSPEKPCPLCGKPASAKYRPFCGSRCADVDLHKWLGGQYGIPAEEEDQPDDEAMGGPASDGDPTRH